MSTTSKVGWVKRTDLSYWHNADRWDLRLESSKAEVDDFDLSVEKVEKRYEAWGKAVHGEGRFLLGSAKNLEAAKILALTKYAEWAEQLSASLAANAKEARAMLEER